MRKECKWCRGTGTITGDHPAYECTDCDGKGCLYQCEKCDQWFPPSQVDGSDVCDDCREIDDDEDDG